MFKINNNVLKYCVLVIFLCVHVLYVRNRLRERIMEPFSITPHNRNAKQYVLQLIIDGSTCPEDDTYPGKKKLVYHNS